MVQYSDPEDTSELLPSCKTTLVQQVIGAFLYYGIVLDNTLLMGLNDISLEQSKAITNTAMGH